MPSKRHPGHPVRRGAVDLQVLQPRQGQHQVEGFGSRLQQLQLGDGRALAAIVDAEEVVDSVDRQVGEAGQVDEAEAGCPFIAVVQAVAPEQQLPQVGEARELLQRAHGQLAGAAVGEVQAGEAAQLSQRRDGAAALDAEAPPERQRLQPGQGAERTELRCRWGRERGAGLAWHGLAAAQATGSHSDKGAWVQAPGRCNGAARSLATGSSGRGVGHAACELEGVPGGSGEEVFGQAVGDRSEAEAPSSPKRHGTVAAATSRPCVWDTLC
jgi:hypothetical protein